MVKLIVDGKEILAREGMSLLEACLDNGIYIPNLCFMKEMTNPPASCRLCFVEIEGRSKPVCSCKVPVSSNLVVKTDTEPVRQLQRTALRLLLSVHNATCRRCPSNRRCDLQRMVRLLGVRLRPRRFEHIDRPALPEQSHPFFDFIPSRCILCGKCIYVCGEKHGRSLLTFAKRGFDTVLTSFENPELLEQTCGDCRACMEICPVSAILRVTNDKLQMPKVTNDK